MEKTLKALRLLECVDYEIIVSDGRSTDSTLEIAKKYADKIVVYEGNARQTISNARNLGAAKAGGDFLVFIDADVVIPDINDFFNKVLELFRDNRKLVAATVFMRVFPEHATLSDKFFFGIVNFILYISNNIFHSGASGGEFQMARSEVFRESGGYNETLVVGEDNDFFSRLSKMGRTMAIAGLHVFHTGRRAHSIGWAKLLFLWWGNMIFNKLFKRSLSSEWKVIR